MEPMCGRCGKVMTPGDSKLRPELFLHDACLPDEFKPIIPAGGPKQYRCHKAPFSSARTFIGGGHTDIHLWVNGGKAGVITVRNEEVDALLIVIGAVEDDA